MEKQIIFILLQACVGNVKRVSKVYKHENRAIYLEFFFDGKKHQIEYDLRDVEKVCDPELKVGRVVLCKRKKQPPVVVIITKFKVDAEHPTPEDSNMVGVVNFSDQSMHRHVHKNQLKVVSPNVIQNHLRANTKRKVAKKRLIHPLNIINHHCKKHRQNGKFMMSKEDAIQAIADEGSSEKETKTSKEVDKVMQNFS